MTTAADDRWAAGVVIPAQNEELTIVACLSSVLAASSASRCDGSVWIVVVADCCTDRTVELARRLLGTRGEVIECAARSPGTARGIGVAALFRHFANTPPHRVWIANTDADTTVPIDWIDVHLDAADQNVGAVAGIVDLAEAGLRPDVSQLYGEMYLTNADGTHQHVHGANIGIRGDAYLDAGGWSDAAVSEDHCLWGRLRVRGWMLRSTVLSVVRTSARLHGRAIGGFADRLRTELAKCTG